VIARPAFAFYGDDFTGSTDALEALSSRGIEAVLFLEMPDSGMFEEFKSSKAIGIAGDSRSRSPEWMSQHLPSIFQMLKETRAGICQYKICSTFDSSPETGSIGRAIEIGKDVFGSQCVPVFAAAPHLKRYVVFGNLFAAAGENVFRIDRHPGMSRHPVTPMNEGDLRVHLGRQTAVSISSFDILQITSPTADMQFEQLLQHRPQAILFDGLDEDSLRKGAGMVWKRCGACPFVVGSSGFTHGLAAYWQSAGLIHEMPRSNTAKCVDRLAVLSGSCSPVTETQIRWALANGFDGHQINGSALLNELNTEKRRLVQNACKSLNNGRSVLLYSALGSDGFDGRVDRCRLGEEMGLLLRDVLFESGVRRAVIAGGDTSSYAGRQLGVYALTMEAALSPGAPLCRAYTHEKGLTGLELVFKGGQVGREEFFGTVREGA
jgi:uncharacterized protein YgbK (DUF1537 family)